MSTPDRVSAVEAYQTLKSNSNNRLVCIYPHENWIGSHLEGSISLKTLESEIDSLPNDATLVFY